MADAKTDTYEPKTLSDIEHLMAHAAIENAAAKTARIKARTAVWTGLSITVMMSVPAAIIFVYAALWGWLQK